jgi:lipopolysaccharide transport system permease protein
VFPCESAHSSTGPAIPRFILSTTDLPASYSDSHALPVRVLEPHSGLDAFREAGGSLWTSFGQARQLAWRFFLRDTRADHRQSVLGYVWLLVPALANTVVWVFLNDQKIIEVNSGAIPYPLFVLAGVVIWTAFNASVMAMLSVIGEARGMLAKVSFPHEALVYSAFLKSLLNALITSLVLIPALLLFATRWQIEMLLFPVALIASLLLGCALGLIALPIAALYADVGRAVQLILRFGFFLTPVIFALPPAGMARRLMLLNPVTPVIASGRAWLAGSGEAMPGAFLAVVAGCVIVLALGLLVYKVALPHLIERLGG